MVEMHLASIRVEMPSNTPVVLLQEKAGRRTLPILIGHPEATAIAFALQGVEVPRPMTHDLLKDVIEGLGATVDEVVITELVARTYYAEIRLTIDGRRVTISSRPSDAMALAVRVGARIYADDDLLDAEGVILDDDSESDDEPAGDSEEVIKQFQEFIDKITPEDFSQ